MGIFGIFRRLDALEDDLGAAWRHCDNLSGRIGQLEEKVSLLAESVENIRSAADLQDDTDTKQDEAFRKGVANLLNYAAKSGIRGIDTK